MPAKLSYARVGSALEVQLEQIYYEIGLNKPRTKISAKARRDEIYLNGQVQGIKRAGRKLGIKCNCVYSKMKGGQRCLCVDGKAGK